MRRALTLAAVFLILIPGAAAIDLNSSRSLQYFSGTNLNFEVQTDGQLNAFNTLDLSGNRIESLGSANSGDDAMPRGDILNEFVDEAGDSMTGNLDMGGTNALLNVDRIGNGTNTLAVTSTTDLQGNTLQNPGSITSYYDSSPCSGTEAVQDINDDGTFSCVQTSDTAQDVWVNESGDTMSGILNMGGNRVEGVGSHDSGDDVMRQDDIDTTYVNEAGDTMTGTLDMTDDNIENVNRIQTEKLNVTNETSSVQIADFTDSGVTIHQPLTVESSGPLSVANGIDLTDATANTIESSGTFYLSTSSGSPTDIVFQPTGVVASQANIDMGGNNITNTDHLNPDGTTLSIGGTLAMDGNTLQNLGSITSYYGAGCSGTQAVQDISDSGGFTCVDTTDSAQDVWVNESGDTMSGILSMGSNRIEGLASADSGDDAMRRDDAISTFVDAAGDSMTGNLDMGGTNALLNVDSIGNGTNTLGVTSTLGMGGNNIQNPGSITSYFGSACGAGQAVQDVADGGGFTCVSVDEGETDVWVNESGDTMSGALDMSGNNVTNIGAGNIHIADPQGDLDMNTNRVEGLQSADSGDDAMRRDDALGTFVDEAGDTMTGQLDMSNNNLANVNSLTFNDLGESEGFLWGNGRSVAVSTGNQGGEDAFIWRTDSTYPIQIETHNSAGTDTDRLNISTGVDTAAMDIINMNIDMNGNTIQNPGSITSYFGSACGSQQAVQDIADGGGFTCVDVSDNGVDYNALVNRSGGSANSMTGNFNVGGNRIQNLASHNSGDDAMRRDDIVSDFVDANGDTMSGNLDLNGNELQNNGAVWWGVMSLETGDWKMSNGTTGTLTPPGESSTACSGNLACMKQFDTDQWAIEFNVEKGLAFDEASFPNSWACHGISAGDNEQSNADWGEGVRSTMTDANGHCVGSLGGNSDCAASFVYDSSHTSHDTYGIVCKKLY